MLIVVEFCWFDFYWCGLIGWIGWFNCYDGCGLLVVCCYVLVCCCDWIGCFGGLLLFWFVCYRLFCLTGLLFCLFGCVAWVFGCLLFVMLILFSFVVRLLRCVAVYLC